MRPDRRLKRYPYGIPRHERFRKGNQAGTVVCRLFDNGTSLVHRGIGLHEYRGDVSCGHFVCGIANHMICSVVLVVFGGAAELNAFALRESGSGCPGRVQMQVAPRRLTNDSDETCRWGIAAWLTVQLPRARRSREMNPYVQGAQKRQAKDGQAGPEGADSLQPLLCEASRL